MILFRRQDRFPAPGGWFIRGGRRLAVGAGLALTLLVSGVVASGLCVSPPASAWAQMPDPVTRAMPGPIPGPIPGPMPGPMSDPMPGPRIMLCLYDGRGVLLAGSVQCPLTVRRRDAILPQAHCFYDMQGFLWRGLPRCPPRAPHFLMDEARHATGPQG